MNFQWARSTRLLVIMLTITVVIVGILTVLVMRQQRDLSTVAGHLRLGTAPAAPGASVPAGADIVATPPATHPDPAASADSAKAPVGPASQPAAASPPADPAPQVVPAPPADPVPAAAPAPGLSTTQITPAQVAPARTPTRVTPPRQAPPAPKTPQQQVIPAPAPVQPAPAAPKPDPDTPSKPDSHSDDSWGTSNLPNTAPDKHGPSKPGKPDPAVKPTDPNSARGSYPSDRPAAPAHQKRSDDSGPAGDMRSDLDIPSKPSTPDPAGKPAHPDAPEWVKAATRSAATPSSPKVPAAHHEAPAAQPDAASVPRPPKPVDGKRLEDTDGSQYGSGDNP